MLVDEIETDRLDRLNEATKVYGDLDLLQKQYVCGTFGHHEALTHAAAQAGALETLLSHPTILLRPELFALVRQIDDKMQELYQALGAGHCE